LPSDPTVAISVDDLASLRVSEAARSGATEHVEGTGTSLDDITGLRGGIPPATPPSAAPPPDVPPPVATPAAPETASAGEIRREPATPRSERASDKDEPVSDPRVAS
jgi:hypothetical protein